MENPLVSVIIPAHNRAQLVQKAIESVLMQSYKNLEIIVVDDASDDATPQVLANFSASDPRVKVLTNEKNLGLVRNLNKGISVSRGKYIARLDDDDLWIDPGKIENQVQFLEDNKDYVLIGSGVIKVDEQGKEVSRILFPEKDKEIREIMFLKSPFVHSGVVFRKDVFEKLGGYNENLKVCEDYDLWMRMGKTGKFYNIPEYFVRYRESQGNLSYTQLRKIFKQNIILVGKYRKNYPHFLKAIIIRCCYYFYSFIPLRNYIRPFFSKIKKIIYGI
jgi:glycosyltransferase involved in cell wall biosynthesis